MSILPARLRARQVLFVGQTTKCTHIGLEGQVQAPKGLPTPLAPMRFQSYRVGTGRITALVGVRISSEIDRHLCPGIATVRM